MFNTSEIISLCDGVAKETCHYSQGEKDALISSFIAENWGTVDIKLSEMDDLPLVKRMLVANVFYSSVMDKIILMSKIILVTRSISPLFKFFIDYRFCETALNEKISDEMLALSSGRISNQGKEFLVAQISGWNKRMTGFLVRLISAVIVHFDILGIIFFSVIRFCS